MTLAEVVALPKSHPLRFVLLYGRSAAEWLDHHTSGREYERPQQRAERGERTASITIHEGGTNQ